MKISALFVLILSLASLATAAPKSKFVAFSVNNVVRVKDDIYTAEKNTADTHGEKTAGDIAFQYITLKTESCKHAPGVDASGIILQASDGTAKIMFSDGPSCRVIVLDSRVKK